MADKKISALTGASTPLAGTEVLPIVQSGSTVKVAVSDLTAGRTVNAASLITTGNAGVGVTPSNWGTSGAVFKSIEMGMVGTGVAGLGSPSVPELELLTNVYYNGGLGGWIYANTGATALRASLNGDVAGAFTWNVAPAGTAGSAISFTRAMTLDNSANLTVDAGNVVIGTSGKGIDFSATSGSGTSELLADYEEGTWTPVISGSTTAGAGTYAVQAGSYTKIGNRVLFSAYISWSAHTGTGNMRISGLPAAAVNDNANYGAVTVFMDGAMALTALNILQIRTVPGAATLFPLQVPVGGGAPSQIPLPTSGDIMITGHYYA